MASLFEQQVQNMSSDERAMLRVNDTLNAAVGRIRGNDNLSPVARQRAIAKAYRQAQSEMSQVTSTIAERKQSRVAELNRKSFGVPSDPVERMSYQNALSLADQETDPKMAQFKLERALRTGDAAMAQALAQRASDMAWHKVLAYYTTARPEVGQALSELQQLSSPDPNLQLRQAMYSHVNTPQELERLGDNHINTLAEQADGMSLDTVVPGHV